jgi:hypothetical protein
MKREARMATSDRRKSSITPAGAPDRRAPAIPGPAPLARGELVSLLHRLSGELDEFLNDLGECRESSRNRESSRRA